ncbi:hypothetical protein TWF730_000563 [Orbilia blumenaviensis]|uniref:Uncharacterized protein n=1 Tax=Orbilia blumenaviensis TaxID=1796055 RepID=A0AAV9VQ22_9PEZI
MSVTQQEEEDSAPERQRPPPIRKPRQIGGQSLNTKMLREAFEVEYYLSKTENWQHINMAAVVAILKVCIVY